MLRTNLSTRPFYNERAVRIGIAALVVVVAALTTFNILRIITFNDRTAGTVARAEAAETQTAQYRERARTITEALTTGDVSVVQEAASEANVLIGRRVFSWTDLFNRFESTLPADVRILSVAPQVDREARLMLAVEVIARRVEDLNEFMDQLEVAGGLRDIIARQDETLDDGTVRAVLQGYYVAPEERPTGAAPDASDPGNESPDAPEGGNTSATAPTGDAR